MKIAIMQPYVFPYIGYYQLINTVDKFILLDDVNYINRGWINRNNILLSGKAHLFTIPLYQASQNRLIYEIQVLSDNKWKSKFCQTIYENYKKAPFFSVVYELIYNIIYSECSLIAKLAAASIQQINSYLEINVAFIETSQQYKNRHLKAQNRIIDICKQEAASQYINPIGGIELYDRIAFKEQGIQLNFLKTRNILYRQFQDNFVPNLSIIDVMMFNSPGQIKQFLTEYDLV